MLFLFRLNSASVTRTSYRVVAAKGFAIKECLCSVEVEEAIESDCCIAIFLVPLMDEICIDVDALLANIRHPSQETKCYLLI